MARLTTDDDFWKLCGLIAPQIGSLDAAIGQAMRFRHLAQERTKRKKVITKHDFKLNGFHPALIGVFASDEGSFYAQIYDAEEHDWMLERNAAAQKGGINSAKKRAKEAKIPNAALPCKINNLGASKTEPNSSKSNPLSLPLSLSLPNAVAVANSAQQKVFEERYKQELLDKRGSSSIDQHWIKAIWNEHCGQNLHKIVEIDVELRKLMNAAAKRCADREKWVERVKKVAASKYCNGKGQKFFVANIYWLLEPRNWGKIENGAYFENNAPLIESSKAKKPSPTDINAPVLTPEQRAAALEAMKAVSIAPLRIVQA